MKNCIYEPVFGLFLLFNFQIDSALTFQVDSILIIQSSKKAAPYFGGSLYFILYFIDCFLFIAYYLLLS